MFRHGYRNDFPQNEVPSEDDVDEAILRDRDQKLARKETMNSSSKRVPMKVLVGDKVLLKEYPKGRKFSPIYSEEIHEVIQVESKGVVVKDSQGSIKRRHKDDVKQLNEHGLLAFMSEDEDDEETQGAVELQEPGELVGDEPDEVVQAAQEEQQVEEGDPEEPGDEVPQEPAPLPRPVTRPPGSRNIPRPGRGKLPSRYKDFVMYFVKSFKGGE